VACAAQDDLGAVLFVVRRPRGARYVCVRARRRRGGWRAEEEFWDEWPAHAAAASEAGLAMAAPVTEVQGATMLVVTPLAVSGDVDAVVARLPGARAVATVNPAACAAVVAMQAPLTGEPLELVPRVGDRALETVRVALGVGGALS
jgi:hypothetical protein